ncbi:hypothetical protein B0H15DRAFT_799441 [Mycena belliarum]|uniref:Uncharacterized protein n=1 Tax=Mycena belliarum TaxID=1033014 RepID=A0AAD6UA73_9AGAR|nr:hypothetical protein B0H15DRAFT_799439 [Mycena belliae]KAJ7093007.1 hypothetical protein B0H15DRAFT_799441 [Mycena belliae]
MRPRAQRGTEMKGGRKTNQITSGSRDPASGTPSSRTQAKSSEFGVPTRGCTQGGGKGTALAKMPPAESSVPMPGGSEPRRDADGKSGRWGGRQTGRDSYTFGRRLGVLSVYERARCLSCTHKAHKLFLQVTHESDPFQSAPTRKVVGSADLHEFTVLQIAEPGKLRQGQNVGRRHV